MSAGHVRRGSSRAALPRRTTRGPLDDDDPLSASGSLNLSTVESASSPLVTSTELDASVIAPLTTSQTLLNADPPPLLSGADKDLSFLLDTSIYHPLSNIDVPPLLRRPLPQNPPTNISLDKIFSDVAALLKDCQFLSAAHLAGIILTSGIIQPNDSASIFRLLSIRYSALELCGNVLLAAQEAKALEDLSSSFYYEDVVSAGDHSEEPGTRPSSAKHIMPFDLRLQALRLQGIGFGDSRRAVGALFDLGMECRENAASTDPGKRKTWEARLTEVGVRVVNSLIDIGDFDCAKRTLASIWSSEDVKGTTWDARLILLLIKMGDVNEARTVLNTSGMSPSSQAMLRSFIEIADGKYDDAARTLSQITGEGADQETLVVAKQNLAVAYIYRGEIRRSREILQSLVDSGHSFPALTVNLATIYDLTSDRSKDLKANLVSSVANSKSNQPRRGFVNADFKL